MNAYIFYFFPKVRILHMFETEREPIGNAEANAILRNHARQVTEVILAS